MAQVMLFSAGMDSVILKELLGFSNAQCLFVDMGTKENKLEKQYIQQYYPETQMAELSLVTNELPNKIIPFRNHHLALLAANYGSEIYFAFTAGDTTKDKDYVFKSQIEGILNYFAIDKTKVRLPGPYQIVMPVKKYTKTELVKQYIDKELPIENLLVRSCSCYEGTALPCGSCRSCLRKYVAMQLNGIFCKEFFKQDPVLSLKDFYEESVRKQRVGEIKEIATCMNLEN